MQVLGSNRKVFTFKACIGLGFPFLNFGPGKRIIALNNLSMDLSFSSIALQECLAILFLFLFICLLLTTN